MVMVGERGGVGIDAAFEEWKSHNACNDPHDPIPCMFTIRTL